MTTWRVTLPASRAAAEALPFADDVFADLDEPPALLADEPDPGCPNDWLICGYFNVEPDAEWIERLAGLAGARADAAVVTALADDDWVTLSQAGLAPVSAGRFHVATRAHTHTRYAGQTGLVIEAGLAFGTGQHATTHGCLHALDRLAKRQQFSEILDLGTGSGVLAFAAAKTWRRARVTATDIDPVATAVAHANARSNGVRLGARRGAAMVFTANGMHDRRLAMRGRYDLILANILARPLIALAGPVSAALAPGGTLVLAGLLDTQARRVTSAYAARGLRRVATSGSEWPTLVLRRP